MDKGVLYLGGCVAALCGASTAQAQSVPAPAAPAPTGEPAQPSPLPGLPPPPGAPQTAPAPPVEQAKPHVSPQPAATVAAGEVARPQPVAAGTVSVADQPRPEWDPLGIPVGTLLVYPAVEVDALGKTNVRATEHDEKSDVAAVATAALNANTDWGRHYLGLGGYYRRTQWLSLNDESRSEYGGLGRARYDISSVSTVTAIGQYDRLTQLREDINSPQNARTPAQYDRIRGNLSYQRDNGLILIDAEFTVDRRVYHDTVSFNGDTIDQHSRDFTRYQGALKLGYAVSGSTSLLIAGSLNKRDFDIRSGGIERDSKGGTIEAGVLFRPSSLLSAEIRAGYLFQNFNAPQLRDASGLSLNADIVWNALPLTSFRLEAARKISEASSTVVQSEIITTGTFGIDREILPNLIATAEANYERTSFIGIGRRATLYSVGLKGRYLMSRLTAVTFSVEHVHRSATLPTDRFSGQQGMIGVRFTL
jgi:hypothetical protein